MSIYRLSYDGTKLTKLGNMADIKLPYQRTDYSDYKVYAADNSGHDLDNVVKRHVLLHILSEANDYVIEIAPTPGVLDANGQHYEYVSNLAAFVAAYSNVFSTFTTVYNALP